MALLFAVPQTCPLTALYINIFSIGGKFGWFKIVRLALLNHSQLYMVAGIVSEVDLFKTMGCIIASRKILGVPVRYLSNL